MTWAELLEKYNNIEKSGEPVTEDDLTVWVYLRCLKDAGEEEFKKEKLDKQLTDKTLVPESYEFYKILDKATQYKGKNYFHLKRAYVAAKNRIKQGWKISIKEVDQTSEFIEKNNEETKLTADPIKNKKECLALYEKLLKEYGKEKLEQYGKNPWQKNECGFLEHYKRYAAGCSFARLDKFNNKKVKFENLTPAQLDRKRKEALRKKYEAIKKEVGEDYEHKIEEEKKKYNETVARICQETEDEIKKLKREKFDALDEYSAAVSKGETAYDEKHNIIANSNERVKALIERTTRDIQPDKKGKKNNNKIKQDFSKDLRFNIDEIIKDGGNKKELEGRSTQFKELYEKSEALLGDFESFSLGEDDTVDEKTAKLDSLIKAAGDLQTKATTYVNKRFSFFWSKGRQRKAYALAVIDDLKTKIENLETLKADILEKTNAAEEKSRKAQADIDQKKKTYENLNEQFDSEIKQLEETKTGRISHIKAKSDTVISDLESKWESRLQRNLDLKNFRADALIYEMSRRLFSKEHNPVPDYDDGFERTEKMKKATFENPEAVPGELHGECVGMSLLKQGLKGVAKMTYSPDALLSISNLRLLDHVLDIRRDELEYYAEYEYWYNGRRITGEEVRRNIDKFKKEFNEDNDKGLTCIVKNIKVGRLTDNDNMLRDKTQKSASSERKELPDNLAYDSDTFTAISELDEKMDDFNALIPEHLQKRILSKDKNEEYPVFSYIKSKLSSLKRKMHKKENNEYENNVINRHDLEQQMIYDIYDMHNIDSEKGPDIYLDNYKGNYYDLDMIKNLSMNHKVAGTDDHSLNTDAMPKAYYDRMFKNSSMKLVDRTLRGEDLTKLLDAPKSTDKLLEEILDGIREISTFKTSDLFEYKKHYYTKSGVSEEKPKEAFWVYEDYKSKYEKKAIELYIKINNYIKDHIADIDNTKSVTGILNAWKKQVYLEREKVTIPKDEHAIIIDAVDPDKDKSNEADAHKTENKAADKSIYNDESYRLGVEITMIEEEVFNYKRKTDKKTKDELKDKYKLNEKKVILKDVSEEPLFTKEPTVSDIKQGKIGNCFFLSVLSSVVLNDPNKIKDMIWDNGNGTVTCRFFKREKDVVRPCYVTVSKKIAVCECGKTEDGKTLIENTATSEQLPLWALLLQKAYSFSGLSEPYNTDETLRNLVKRAATYFKLDPDKEPQKVYSNILKTMPPHLSDGEIKKLNGNKMQAEIRRVASHTYCGLDGGRSGFVLSALTGESYTDIYFDVTLFNDIVSGLENVCKDPQKLTDCRIDTLTEDEKTVLDKIAKLSVLKIRREHIKCEKDNAGRNVIIKDQLQLETVTGAIKEICSHAKLNGLRGYKEELVSKMSDFLIKGIESYQEKAPNDGIHLVSGKSGKYFKYENDIYDDIKKRVNNNEMICCSLERKVEIKARTEKDIDPEVDDMLNEGIITYHAYTVVGCEEENGVKYVVIRNPWATGSRAKGVATFSDGSKAEYHYVDMEDESETSGTFRLELNDFVSESPDLSIKMEGIVPAQIQNKVARVLVQKEKQKDKGNFERKTKGLSEKNILKIAEGSDIAGEYTKKTIRYNELEEKSEKSLLSDSEANEMKLLKDELSAVFGSDIGSSRGIIAEGKDKKSKVKSDNIGTDRTIIRQSEDRNKKETESRENRTAAKKNSLKTEL